jgi:urocanate hydratase
MLAWDVNNGVTRRAWAGNEYAISNIKRQMELDPNMKVTLPNYASNETISKLLK